MSRWRKVTLGEILTPEQCDTATAIYRSERDVTKCVNRLLDDLVIPNMDEIDRKLEQENDPRYIAYIIWFTIYGVTDEGAEFKGEVFIPQSPPMGES